ncbi:ThuA domain-containing protein [Paenibacillus sp. NPDC058071]|uniref:ThuA domain-containing protein n=1 Tax=Paenibacillus sp. NPDC058071 TaxID=3346326 RepID=UPI0036D9562A
MTSIVAIIGDYYHREEPIRKALLTAAHSSFGGEDAVSIRFIDAADLLQALSDRPDAVVLFKENRIDPVGVRDAMWMNDTIERGIESYVKEGGGWLAWHSGLASYPREGAYVGMLRGGFVSHPDQHESVLYEGERDSTVFEIVDEHYFVHCDEARTEVYLRSSSVDGKSIAAWRHTYGKGRVNAFAPAHRQEGLANPELLRLLGEALRWCADRTEAAQ